MAYRATSTTTGRPVMDRKNYVYNGTKPELDHPRAACGEENASRRKARKDKFEVVLTELAGDLEHASAVHIRRAGELVGIGEKTARTYQAELLKERRDA